MAEPVDSLLSNDGAKGLLHPDMLAMINKINRIFFILIWRVKTF